MILEGLQGRAGSTVVLDAGIASQSNIDWLVERGYRYLVVSRKRQRDFDVDKAITVKDLPSQTVKVQRVIDEETGEVELYCHSALREKKEQAIQDRFKARLETTLQSLADGLHKKGTTKRYEKILERIGRVKQKYASAAQYYDIRVTADEQGVNATTIHWERNEKPNSQATHPGIYCLRTNLTDWDENTQWNTYTMLTDLEAVFRSLKSELGLRPIYHHKEARVNGHIFITLIAYHLVHTLRSQLKAHRIHASWEILRRTMENQQRVTVRLTRADGKTLHVRKATRAEPQQKANYDALGISPQPGSTQTTRV